MGGKSGFVTKGFLFWCLLAAVLLMPGICANAKDIVVVIDPGHGGQETGAFRSWYGKDYREEVLNQKIANYVVQELQTYAGVRVVMTRHSVQDPSMDRSSRVYVAQANDAAALVSIHLNATGDVQTQVTGALAYVPSYANYPDSNAAAADARELGREILGQLSADTGMASRGFLFSDGLGIILYGMRARIPSMIIEHCFLNNPGDCKRYLASAAKLRRLGVADATAIASFFQLEKKGTVPTAFGWQADADGDQTYRCENGLLARNEWKRIDGIYYHFNARAKLETGVVRVGTKLFLTNEYGERQQDFCTFQDRQYYAKENGRLYVGWRNYQGERYYFSKETGAALLGYQQIGKKSYYFDPLTGEMLTGWQDVGDGQTRYFNPKNGAQKKNCWIKVKGKYYYLGADGSPYRGVRVRIGKKTYRFNAKGVCKNYR